MSITGVGEVADLIKDGIDKIWPDKTEQEKAQATLLLTSLQGQLAANTAEASSVSTFVAGWRPFIGWVCGSACAWNWIGISIAKMVCALLHYQVALAPADVSEMLPVLMGMLGLGAMRTFEKVNGVNSGH